MLLRYSCLVIAFCLSSYVYATDPKDFQASVSRGFEAMAQSNYKAARVNYLEAIRIARELKMSPQVLAEYIYQAGQASGLACEFNDAERLLLEAISLTDNEPQGVTNIHSAATWKLFELAHFYSDRGLYAQSYPYWNRFLPRYEQLNKTSAQDPIAYSMILREYGKATEVAGEKSDAVVVLKKAEQIETENAEKFTRIAWYKYGKNCK